MRDKSVKFMIEAAHFFAIETSFNVNMLMSRHQKYIDFDDD